MNRRRFRLAHGWRVTADASSDALIREWIRPAVRAIPRSIAAQLPRCDLSVQQQLGGGDQASRWTLTNEALAIAVGTEGTAPHDVAIEVLVCVGQVLWETAMPAVSFGWLEKVGDEIAEGVPGDMDEESLRAKQKLLSDINSARSRHLLVEYARASFAASLAEYIHCLWHDVTLRVGPEHLPAPQVRKRLMFMKEWFPPDRGDQLFAEDNRPS